MNLPIIQPGMRVTVMGLGTFGGGIGAARYCAENGAQVTVTDMKQPEELGGSLDALAGYGIDFVLGEHRSTDFSGADLVVVSPAVPRESRYVQEARNAGVPLTTEIGLFVARCPARVCGITGSNGKTTTVSMLESILSATEIPHHTGGNIGGSLLSSLPDISAGETVVLELSSFQLEWLDETGWSPSIAAVLNIMPNHLDRHGTIEAYARAKASIIRHQHSGDTAILVADDPGAYGLADDVKGRLVTVGIDTGGTDFAFDEGWTIERTDTGAYRLFDAGLVRVPGRHNLLNALTAAACAREIGVGPDSIAKGIGHFNGIAHRLEFVAETGGVTYYNDSKATTPEAAAAGVAAFDQPVIPIFGGYDKKVPFEGLARSVAGKIRWAALIGVTAPSLKTALEDSGVATETFPTLDEAVSACANHAHEGDVVLLSPGCASYDMFPNFETRGDAFRRIVLELAGKRGRGGDESD